MESFDWGIAIGINSEAEGRGAKSALEQPLVAGWTGADRTNQMDERMEWLVSGVTLLPCSSSS